MLIYKWAWLDSRLVRGSDDPRNKEQERHKHLTANLRLPWEGTLWGLIEVIVGSPNISNCRDGGYGENNNC